MLYLTVISAPLPRWVPYPSPLPVDPNFPMFIPVPSRAGACSLSWGKNATRFYLPSFSPGFWHLCILFWYLRVHCIKGSPESKQKKSVWLRFSWDKEGYIWWYFQFVLCTLFISTEFWNWSVCWILQHVFFSWLMPNLMIICLISWMERSTKTELRSFFLKQLLSEQKSHFPGVPV